MEWWKYLIVLIIVTFFVILCMLVYKSVEGFIYGFNILILLYVLLTKYELQEQLERIEEKLK